MPRVYLTDLRPDELLQLERAEPNNRKRFPPSSDDRRLDLLVRRCLEEDRALSMRGFIGYALEWGAEIGAVQAEWNQRFRRRFDEMRQDEDYRRKVKFAVPNSQRSRSLVIYGELWRDFVLNQNAAFTDNQIIDFMHACTSVNCCDFVLLDAAWAGRVDRMLARIAAVDTGMEIARCYSRRDNGSQRLLDDLEAFI
jgi:hypothetical protein